MPRVHARITVDDLRQMAVASPLEAARIWTDLDPDPSTSATVVSQIERALIAGSDASGQIARWFQGRIGFGTAGLRAALGPGPTMMNRMVVRQTTAGLMEWLPEGATVVVAHDHRHGSAEFAHDVAGVVSAAGGVAVLRTKLTPTPMLAFAVRHLGADAGVQITASHNPPQDNGYKLYLADGAQLPPPHDEAIAEAIDRAPLAPAIAEVAPDPRMGEALDAAYVEAIAAMIEQLWPVAELLGHVAPAVYSAMHGVGGATLSRLFARLGLPEPTQVPAQAAPDPDFPTVDFPNPEEPGALDLAIATATEVQADLIVANDPDADRLAVAIAGAHGAVLLTGNEVGALLGDAVLRATSGADRLVATTVVSGGMLSRIAAAHGAECATTLTGFKWIVRPGLERPDRRFVFGYEEAIGFAIGDVVRDKDGLSAAAAIRLVDAGLRADGLDLTDRMADLSRSHGLHISALWNHRFSGIDAARSAASVLDQLRSDPPVSVGGRRVIEVEDLALGETLPPTDGIVMRLDGDVRIVVRPSGTEPKVKAYVELVQPFAGEDGAAWLGARSRGQEAVAEIVEALASSLNVTG